MPRKLIAVENDKWREGTGEDLIFAYPNIEPTSLDSFLLMDESDSSKIKTTTLRQLLAVSILDAFTSGTLASFTTTSTPMALPVFTNATSFYSSTGLLEKSADNTGITVKGGLRWDVSCTMTARTGGNDDWYAQVYAGGIPCGEIQDLSGDGTGKAISADIDCYTHLLNPMDKIELRIWDSGETVTNLTVTMKVRYAGSD